MGQAARIGTTLTLALATAAAFGQANLKGAPAPFNGKKQVHFALVRQMRGGKDYDSTFGKRMTGSGPYAWMIGRRFEIACERLGLNVHKTKLTTEHFKPPRPQAQQLSLF